jgi:hypothetical protein
MARELGEVVYVDGVGAAFGRAGPAGIFWRTRADDVVLAMGMSAALLWQRADVSDDA